MAEVFNLMISNKKNTDPSAIDFWLKRQAIAIVAQLPEDRDEALKVLDYAAALVTDFLAKD